MTMTKLLHVEKFMPKAVIKRVLTLQEKLNLDNIVLSKHVEEHLSDGDHKHDYSKEGLMACLNDIKIVPEVPFEVEVEVEGNRFYITKYVVRVPYSETEDISIVLRGHRVITAWINSEEDTHTTLDLSKYADAI